MKIWTDNKRWTDEGIKWNPNDYEGIQIIRLPVEIVWNPGYYFYIYLSIYIFNFFSMDFKKFLDIFLNNAASEKSWNPWSVTSIFLLRDKNRPHYHNNEYKNRYTCWLLSKWFSLLYTSFFNHNKLQTKYRRFSVW